MEGDSAWVVLRLSPWKRKGQAIEQGTATLVLKCERALVAHLSAELPTPGACLEFEVSEDASLKVKARGPVFALRRVLSPVVDASLVRRRGS